MKAMSLQRRAQEHLSDGPAVIAEFASGPQSHRRAGNDLIVAHVADRQTRGAQNLIWHSGEDKQLPLRQGRFTLQSAKFLCNRSRGVK